MWLIPDLCNTFISFPFILNVSSYNQAYKAIKMNQLLDIILDESKSIILNYVFHWAILPPRGKMFVLRVENLIFV